MRTAVGRTDDHILEETSFRPIGSVINCLDSPIDIGSPTDPSGGMYAAPLLRYNADGLLWTCCNCFGVHLGYAMLVVRGLESLSLNGPLMGTEALYTRGAQLPVDLRDTYAL